MPRAARHSVISISQLGFGLSFAEGPDLVAEAEELADAERAADSRFRKLSGLGLAHVR